MSAPTLASALLTGLCDDAAVFPPGNVPLPEAVLEHLAHRGCPHAGIVGPLVLPAAALGHLRDLVATLPAGCLELAVTAPLGQAATACAAAELIPAVRLVALELALPDDATAADIGPALADLSAGSGCRVYVELPRDVRRPAVLQAVADTGLRAKLRTGGVVAELYPDEAELAAAVTDVVRAGVPFKATAGLHHAVRNTDPTTGFEQHGFLNLLAATGAALAGADQPEVVEVLADRDPARVAARVRGLDPTVREVFCSFGTCSVVDPVQELIALDLLPTRSPEPAR